MKNMTLIYGMAETDRIETSENFVEKNDINIINQKNKKNLSETLEMLLKIFMFMKEQTSLLDDELVKLKSKISHSDINVYKNIYDNILSNYIDFTKIQLQIPSIDNTGTLIKSYSDKTETTTYNLNYKQKEGEWSINIDMCIVDNISIAEENDQYNINIGNIKIILHKSNHKKNNKTVDSSTTNAKGSSDIFYDFIAEEISTCRFLIAIFTSNIKLINNALEHLDKLTQQFEMI